MFMLLRAYSINTSNFSSVITRFRDIAAFMLQHTTFPTHLSSNQNFHVFRWEYRWMSFGLRRAGVLG